ncbi:Hypothetical predicted protein [Scomber scombrus]|uniref:Uncharacterized protein n=1 Tax=Scomber scombrus TaxID=13677 RepID=A0AAV1Q531_SCOSC
MTVSICLDLTLDQLTGSQRPLPAAAALRCGRGAFTSNESLTPASSQRLGGVTVSDRDYAAALIGVQAEAPSPQQL